MGGWAAGRVPAQNVASLARRSLSVDRVLRTRLPSASPLWELNRIGSWSCNIGSDSVGSSQIGPDGCISPGASFGALASDGTACRARSCLFRSGVFGFVLSRLNIGLFHKTLPPRGLHVFIWVRFVKTGFITNTEAARNVHIPVEKRCSSVLVALIIWVRFAKFFHVRGAGCRPPLAFAFSFHHRGVYSKFSIMSREICCLFRVSRWAADFTAEAPGGRGKRTAWVTPGRKGAKPLAASRLCVSQSSPRSLRLCGEL